MEQIKKSNHFNWE